MQNSVFSTTFNPLLLYGVECWAITRKLESKIQTAKMRVLTLNRGVTRRDRMRNVQIRRDKTSLLEDVDRAGLKSFNHEHNEKGRRSAYKEINGFDTKRKAITWQTEEKMETGC